MQHNLIGKLQKLGIPRAGIALQGGAFGLVRNGLRRLLAERDAIEQAGKVGQRAGKRQAAGKHRIRLRHQRGHIARNQRIKQRVEVFLAHRAQHLRHLRLAHRARAVGDALVQQGKRITHRTIGRARNVAQRAGLKGHGLLRQNVFQMRANRGCCHLFEVELQAARKDGDGDFLRVGRRQNELDVLRRLFQRFQHGVESMAGEHVHFVNHIDLEAPGHRRIDRLIEQRGHVIDATV